MRSIQEVCEQLKSERNAEITILDVFTHSFGHHKSTSPNKQHIVRLQFSFDGGYSLGDGWDNLEGEP